MSELAELRDKLMKELVKITRKDEDMSTACLETVYKLVESIKGIDTIEAMDDYDGYSRNDRPSGNSYARRWDTSTRGRYSRHDRKEHLVSELEEMLDKAPSEKARDAIETVMAQLRLG